MTTKTQDYSKMAQEMMASFPVDFSAMQDSFKTYASMGEKMSKVALDAAEKSNEISGKWTKDTLSKMSHITAAREEPAEYGKAVTDFASNQAETTAESMAAFAEVAKKVQTETVELMMAAGKNMSEDMSAATRKATGEMTNAAKKATAQAK